VGRATTNVSHNVELKSVNSAAAFHRVKVRGFLGGGPCGSVRFPGRHQPYRETSFLVAPFAGGYREN